MKNYFAKNISYLIDNNIISVETILKITNHNSPGLISMWKSGERNIMTNDLIAIANFLNYTVDDLINKDLSKKDSELSKSELDVLFDKHKKILERNNWIQAILILSLFGKNITIEKLDILLTKLENGTLIKEDILEKGSE